jgi:hypothetical protein
LDIEKKIELTELQIRVLTHLELGHEHAISLRNLCLRSGISERKIRMTIESLRREKWAVLIPQKAPFGYFLASSKTELEEYSHYMKSRLINEYRTYKIVRKATIMNFNKVTQLPMLLGE